MWHVTKIQGHYYVKKVQAGINSQFDKTKTYLLVSDIIPISGF